MHTQALARIPATCQPEPNISIAGFTLILRQSFHSPPMSNPKACRDARRSIGHQLLPAETKTGPFDTFEHVWQVPETYLALASHQPSSFCSERMAGSWRSFLELVGHASGFLWETPPKSLVQLKPKHLDRGVCLQPLLRTRWIFFWFPLGERKPQPLSVGPGPAPLGFVELYFWGQKKGKAERTNPFSFGGRFF